MKCAAGYEMGKKDFCQECGARANETCPRYVEPVGPRITFACEQIIGGVRINPGTYELRRVNPPSDEILF